MSPRPYAGKSGTFRGVLGRSDGDLIEKLSETSFLEYIPGTRENPIIQEDEAEATNPPKNDSSP